MDKHLPGRQFGREYVARRTRRRTAWATLVAVLGTAAVGWGAATEIPGTSSHAAAAAVAKAAAAPTTTAPTTTTSAAS